MNEQKNLLIVLGEWWERHNSRERSAVLNRPPGRLDRVLRWFLPNGGTLLLVAALILTQQVWAKPLASPASAPGPSATTVNYQGRLADSGGNPLDGTYGMSFSLWDASTGGSLVWGPEGHAAVPVSDGLFSVGLGSQTSGGIPTSAWNGDRYLEITVGGETLSPRELIRSVPIAGMALTVPDGTIGTEQIEDGAVTPDKAPNLLQSPSSNQILKAGTTVLVGNSSTEFDIPLGYSFPNEHTAFIALVGATNQPDGVYVRVAKVVNQSTGRVRMSIPVSGHIRFNWIAIGN